MELKMQIMIGLKLMFFGLLGVFAALTMFYFLIKILMALLNKNS